MQFRSLIFCSAALFLCTTAATASAGSITLQWDPANDGVTSGYVVVYGTASRTYTVERNVGAVTSYRVDGLADGTRYCFAVRAYNGSSVRSDPSNEVCATATATTTGTTSPAPTTGSTTGSSAPPAPAPSAPTTGSSTVDSSGTRSVTSLSIASGITAPRLQLRATVRGPLVDLDWTPTSDGAPSYRVEIGRNRGETVLSGLSAATSTTVDLSPLGAGTYYGRIVAVRADGYGDYSDDTIMVMGAPSTPGSGGGTSGMCNLPQAPPRLSAVAQGALVQLTWDRAAGDMPSAYQLQVGSAPGRQDITVVSLGADTGFSATAPDGVYALRLVALNACGTSALGAEAMLVVGASSAAPGPGGVVLPGAPEGLSWQVTDGTVVLTWFAPITGGAATRYAIEAITAGGPVGIELGNVTMFSHPNTPSGQYVVRVRAGNAAGFGPASQPVTVIVP